jgi:hypothetical protein
VTKIAYAPTGYRLPAAITLFLQGELVERIEETPHLEWPAIVVFDPDATAASAANRVRQMPFAWEDE